MKRSGQFSDMNASEGSPPSPSLAPTPTAPKSAPAAPGIDPAAALTALGNPLRWEMFKMLAGGEALSASQMAARLGRDFDGVSKHLRVLRAGGVVSSRAGEDRRNALYFIPAELRREPGVVDYGFCLFRLPAARGEPAA